MHHPGPLVHWPGDPYFRKISETPDDRGGEGSYPPNPGGRRPSSTAFTAACVRSETPSLGSMCSRCLFTVERERCSSFAIWRLVLPEAIWPRISVSLGVSGLSIEDAEERGSTEVVDCVCGRTFSCTAASSPRLLRSFMASLWSRGVSPSSTALTASRTWSGFSPFRT